MIERIRIKQRKRVASPRRRIEKKNDEMLLIFYLFS
jgi:hypothetical protein